MPSRHVIRHFEEDGIYHVFNRGVEKRNIFLDNQGYNIFLYYLFVYIVPLNEVLLRYPDLPIRLYKKNLSSEVDVLAYCLMPNHFHLLLQQKSIDGVSKLLKRLTNAYTLYFNNKYQRVGGLVQGRFKAVQMETDEQLLHVSRYIHLNPLAAEMTENLESYRWSSFPDYINNRNGKVCNKKVITSFFSSPGTYETFIMDQSDYAQKLEKLKHLSLD